MSKNCEYCQKKIVAIGDSRKNGSKHKDWEKRKLHKTCWKLIHDCNLSKCKNCNIYRIRGYSKDTCEICINKKYKDPNINFCKKCNKLISIDYKYCFKCNDAFKNNDIVFLPEE